MSLQPSSLLLFSPGNSRPLALRIAGQLGVLLAASEEREFDRLEAVGIDRVIVLDVHNEAAFDNAFRCPTIRLESATIFATDLAADQAAAPLVVVSPTSAASSARSAFSSSSNRGSAVAQALPSWRRSVPGASFPEKR